MSNPQRPNPFRIGGLVEGEYFTDRTDELARIASTLREPSAKLLVSGYRRMGKSSTLARAVDQVNADGGHAIVADFSTASTVTDMANNLLAAAGKTLGRRWTSLLSDMAGRFQVALKLSPDPVSGLTLPSLDVGLRQESLATQQATLANVLDTLDQLAAARQTSLGIVLDEFQEIARFGGGPKPAGSEGLTKKRQDQPEWHLRGTMQRHQHLSYVLAGSKPSLIAAMTGKSGAFYQMLDPYAFRPIAKAHMSQWIDTRLAAGGLQPNGAGQWCVEWAGPRTRDIVRLARKCFDRANVNPVIDAQAVAAAFGEIVLDEEHEAMQAWWNRRSVLHQNVLRALAAEPMGPTTAAMRRQFSLNGTTVGNALRALVQTGDLVRSKYGSTYAFDDAFARGWVIAKALPDIGIRDKLITHIATPTSEYD